MRCLAALSYLDRVEGKGFLFKLGRLSPSSVTRVVVVVGLVAVDGAGGDKDCSSRMGDRGVGENLLPTLLAGTGEDAKEGGDPPPTNEKEGLTALVDDKGGECGRDMFRLVTF